MKNISLFLVALVVITACKQTANSTVQTPNDGRPTEADVLAAGSELAANTLVVVKDAYGRDVDEPALAATKATILETSMDGNLCVVVFNSDVRYLPAFKNSMGVSGDIYPGAQPGHDKPQLANWLRTANGAHGGSVYLWDAQWYDSQHNLNVSLLQK